LVIFFLLLLVVIEDFLEGLAGLGVEIDRLLRLLRLLVGLLFGVLARLRLLIPTAGLMLRTFIALA